MMMGKYDRSRLVTAGNRQIAEMLTSTKKEARQLEPIFDTITDVIFDELLKGELVELPYSMGILHIRKRRRSIKTQEDGTVKAVGYNTDWGATRKLWREDPKAREEKRLVKVIDSNPYQYNLKLFKGCLQHNIPIILKSTMNFRKALNRAIVDNPDFDVISTPNRLSEMSRSKKGKYDRADDKHKADIG